MIISKINNHIEKTLKLVVEIAYFDITRLLKDFIFLQLSKLKKHVLF